MARMRSCTTSQVSLVFSVITSVAGMMPHTSCENATRFVGLGNPPPRAACPLRDTLG
jgi:hypothetical protein